MARHHAGPFDPMSVQSKGSRWSILLAGGGGMRLAKLVHWFHADGRPKQFATLIGTRSMLQHTYSRALAASHPEKIIVMVTSGQERWAYQQLPDVRVGNFMVQPMDLGTGPAISMAIARVMAQDPDAAAVIYPSDHFIYPEDAFSAYVTRVLGAMEASNGTNALLLGAKPTSARMGMGWVIPGKALSEENGIAFHEVAGFTEKPSAGIARQLMESGAVWNTFIMIGKAKAFDSLLRKEHPDLAGRMDQYARKWLEGSDPARAGAVFNDMSPFDFSVKVLQQNEEHLTLLLLDGVHWQDWGTPEGFFQSIEEMGWSDRLDEKIVASEYAELQPN